MAKRQFNSNRGERIASKVQTLVAEILRDVWGEDKLVAGVSLVGSVAHGGLQFVRLFYYSRNPDIDAVQKRLDEITRMVRFELAHRMNQKSIQGRRVRSMVQTWFRQLQISPEPRPQQMLFPILAAHI